MILKSRMGHSLVTMVKLLMESHAIKPNKTILLIIMGLVKITQILKQMALHPITQQIQMLHNHLRMKLRIRTALNLQGTKLRLMVTRLVIQLLTRQIPLQIPQIMGIRDSKIKLNLSKIPHYMALNQ